MARTYLLTLATILSILFQVFSSPSQVDSFRVLTTSGEVSGFINSTIAPHVAQFLGIPYAEHPIGKLRFSPPVAKSPSIGLFNATKLGPSCPQYNTSIPTFFSVGVPEYYIEGPMAEECLSLNIWTPSLALNSQRNYYERIEQNEKLPVIIFIHGGQFTVGGSRVAYHMPERWVERSQRHIVVTINYRLNIFGFPNAHNLNSTSLNLGFLDQRLAVKWVQSNIASFGGDPSKITLFGQSAGAVAVDAYNLAYPDDPIVTGLIMNSGTALLSTFSRDLAQTNFTFVANSLGCKNSTAAVVLECFRGVPFERIQGFLKEYQDSDKRPPIAFLPVKDDVTFFTDPAARAKEGKLTKKPAIIGSTANEGASLARPYTAKGPSKEAMQRGTLGFLCSAVKTTSYRYANNLTTYTYYYAGNFSNVSPLPWQGAYHSSDLPLIFGTSEIKNGKSTAFETEVGNRIQDPSSLPGQGWPRYEPKGQAMAFGLEKQTAILVPVANIQAPCSSDM